MSEIYLTDVVIRFPSDDRNDLPDDAQLFLFVDDDDGETKKTGYFVKEPTGRSWRFDEDIQLFDNASSAKLTVMMEYPLHTSKQLGVVELTKADLRAQYAEGHNEIVRAIVQIADGPPLEFVSHCIIIPDIPLETSSNQFEDAAEEEAFTHRLGLATSFGQIMTRDDVPRITADVKYAQALGLSDENPEKPLLLMHTGILYLELYEQLDRNADLDNAISVYKAAVRITPEGHECQAELYSRLGIALLRRIDHSGEMTDVNDAIFAFECSCMLTPDGHADKPYFLNGLGISLTRCFEQSGDLADIDKAIIAHEEAVHLTPDGHAEKPGYLNNLGNSLSCRFQQSGDLVDVDKAITAQEQAVHLTPDGHVGQPTCLYNLGSSFLCRFRQSGDLVDVDKAITAQEQALHLTPDGHAKKSIYLSNLGNSFLCRFEQSGDLVDVNKAITVQRQAVSLTPDGNVNKPAHLNNLGNSLSYHFKESGDLADISFAITAQERAVHLTPDGHADKPTYLSNLGNSLSWCFEKFGDLVDIDMAITVQEQAIHLTPNGHANKPVHLSSLGISLLCRFRQSGDLVDVDKAITAQKQAILLTPDDHADKPSHLSNLGDSLLCCFEQSGDLVDLDKAITAYKNAATHLTGPPSVRFKAALTWARLASRMDASFALHGYTVALNLLPQIAWLGQTIQAQHKELTSVGQIASEAAAAAISIEHYNTALEWLEQGRSIVWNQLLQLRTPLEALLEVQPALAKDIIDVSKALEHAISASASTQDLFTQSDHQISLEQAAQGHRRLAEKWKMLVKKAHDIPGFEDFLQPKKIEKLCRAADSGPVVVINIHKHRCDALILMAGLDEVIPIPLESFSYEKAQKMHLALNQLLLHSGVRARDTRALRRATTVPGTGFPSILSDLWSYIVKPVLDGLAITASNVTDPPHIWWCPTGPLAFLPIHAAGIYDKSVVGFNISDYVVSSYTPTLSALINATKDYKTCQEFQGLLAVSQPNTPGYTTLPNTTLELTHIQNQAHNSSVHCLEGPAASVENVVKGMEVHSWVHLACHAVQDTKEPTKSALCLHDGHLELSTIITKSFSHAEFAFLSACQTATGDENLSEEAVHLAAGLMLAGYHGVIATMWSIKDKDAPIIADHVYKKLFSAVEPDSTKAAHALHYAVKVLRQQVGDSAFLSWVPFIHIGV